MKKILSHITEGGKYSLVRSMDDTYFNDKYPYNQTIKKTLNNTEIVKVHLSKSDIQNRRLLRSIL